VAFYRPTPPCNTPRVATANAGCCQSERHASCDPGRICRRCRRRVARSRCSFQSDLLKREYIAVVESVLFFTVITGHYRLARLRISLLPSTRIRRDRNPSLGFMAHGPEIKFSQDRFSKLLHICGVSHGALLQLTRSCGDCEGKSRRDWSATWNGSVEIDQQCTLPRRRLMIPVGRLRLLIEEFRYGMTSSGRSFSDYPPRFPALLPCPTPCLAARARTPGRMPIHASAPCAMALSRGDVSPAP
jgi:hypothetical protein